MIYEVFYDKLAEQSSMKYRLLFLFLRFLVYTKRFLWFFGARFSAALVAVLGKILRPFGYVNYKIGYFFKKHGFAGSRWWWKREVQQVLLLSFLILISFPETAWFKQKSTYVPGQKTTINKLVGTADDELALEELVANEPDVPSQTESWNSGALVANPGLGSATERQISFIDEAQFVNSRNFALTKQVVFSGETTPAVISHDQVVAYEVRSGDSLRSIAQDFGVSVATILWENNLTERSTIHPGDVLRILPVSGIQYVVKKGDTLKKIALQYGSTVDSIADVNDLNVSGINLVAGKRIIIPNGTRQVVQVAQPSTRAPVITPAVNRVATPPASTANPSASGFVWPTASRTVTQYFNVSHHAIDIAGPWQTPIYAAKTGVVEKAQCGWNSGYGCYIIINHGNGVKTLYGHNSQLLVSPGDQVETGQTIALMGNTGKVRGVTGIHSHFEVQIDGVRKNPLGYVK